MIPVAWLPPCVRTRCGARLSAVPLPQTVAEDRANPQLALRRSARSRSAEPIQRASWTPCPRTGPASCIAARFAKAWPRLKLRRAAGRVLAAGDARECSAGGPARARSEYRYRSPPRDGLQTPSRCFREGDHDVGSQVDHPARADRSRAYCRQPASGRRAANCASVGKTSLVLGGCKMQ
jgi:hypothetical protein